MADETESSPIAAEVEEGFDNDAAEKDFVVTAQMLFGNIFNKIRIVFNINSSGRSQRLHSTRITQMVLCPENAHGKSTIGLVRVAELEDGNAQGLSLC